MNIKELRSVLRVNNIPIDLYNLEGTGRNDERFCIETDGEEWIVYFTERGTKTMEVKFSTVDGACRYLLKQLVD